MDNKKKRGKELIARLDAQISDVQLQQGSEPRTSIKKLLEEACTFFSPIEPSLPNRLELLRDLTLLIKKHK